MLLLFILKIDSELDEAVDLIIRNPSAHNGSADPVFIQNDHIAGVLL